MTWKCSCVSVALRSVILILAWPITFEDKGRRKCAGFIQQSSPRRLYSCAGRRLARLLMYRSMERHLTPVTTAVQALRERSILLYATIVPRYCSNEEGMTFGPRVPLYATFLSQTMMEWPSARLPYQSNTSAASNLMATDRNLSFMIPCFRLLFRIRTG